MIQWRRVEQSEATISNVHGRRWFFFGLDNDDDGGKWTRHDLLFGSVREAKKVAFK